MDARFRYPLDPQPRMATFLEPGRWHAGDADTAVIAARLLHRVWSDAWVPMLPLVVVTGPRYGLLTGEDRDLIWHRWGVPVYELLTDATGAVIASECDAHQGLHVHCPDADAAVRECGCGVTGPMLGFGVKADAVAA